MVASSGNYCSLNRPWHIANTTVRNPFRLKGGLEALLAAGFEGQMGKCQEESMAWALHNAGIIRLSDKTKDITSIARKWRGALIKLGFIWPDSKALKEIDGFEPKQLGAPYTLTPNGRNLIQAKSHPAQQEVFLRALSILSLPSPLEPGYECSPFLPLQYVLRLLEALKAVGEDQAFLSRLETASLVITSDPSKDFDDVVASILDQRARRVQAPSKRRFDSQEIKHHSDRIGRKDDTLYDYQDASFRYLKATGLFQARGRGIAIVPEKSVTASLLCESMLPIVDPTDYCLALASGAILPTDSVEGGQQQLESLINIGKSYDIDFDPLQYDLGSAAGISSARHDLETAIFEAKEIVYASNQASQIGEIIQYLRMLEGNGSSVVYGDNELFLPRGERPAYFEWVLWRILLALNSLVVPPSKVRRFHIDQDFLPIGTAVGGGADVIGVYKDSVLVVEVTLTENSRQEAAEGEPVRRHVADLAEQYEVEGKRVYGLFVAKKIDTNTAETFRIGVWYRSDDYRMELDVVPLTIAQLRGILEAAVARGELTPEVLFSVIKESVAHRSQVDGAPAWKQGINSIVEGRIETLLDNFWEPLTEVKSDEGSISSGKVKPKVTGKVRKPAQGDSDFKFPS